MDNLEAVLMGAVAMASFVATLFFLRFWRRTRDSLFMFFAVAFGVDAAMRLVLGTGHFSGEFEPLFYLGRVITFGLIVVAIVNKNRPGLGRN